MIINLTAASQDLFISLAQEAEEWNGTPLLDITLAQRGNLTDLKKNDLLTTFKDEGCDWVLFTDAGKTFAASLGINL
jgi:hypothetical protein